MVQCCVVYVRALILGVGVFPEKWGWGVPPTSQNPYPNHDQNLQFSLPYLWGDQKFDILFMTVAAGTVVLSMINKK